MTGVQTCALPICPFDSVISKDENVKQVNIVYNTLEAAEGWYNLVIDSDGYPIQPTCLGCKIVEIDDEGKIGNTVKKSINLFLNPTTP